MQNVETPPQIAARWKREGKSFRPGDVDEEFSRQGAWYVREREDAILRDAPDSEVAGQIRDHRVAGNWTTQRRDPAPAQPKI